jgi:hypothetical protein
VRGYEDGNDLTNIFKKRQVLKEIGRLSERGKNYA